MHCTDQFYTMAKAVVAATGCEWDGIQVPFESDPSRAAVQFYHNPTHRWLVVPVDLDATTAEQLQNDIVTAIAERGAFKKRGSMTLIQKLISVYEEIDHIQKAGHNKNQNYDFVRAADMVRAVRKALFKLGVYAEVNFSIEKEYTIAREKAPNAPFSAVDVRCTMVFRDSESSDTLTSSGLGTGADTGDKAIYKAQTGATKYCLRNAFLVPDEADPEADSTTDENTTSGRRAPEEIPDYNDFQGATEYNRSRGGAGRPASTPKVPAAKLPLAAPIAPASEGSSWPAPSTETRPLFDTPPVVPVQQREPGDDAESDRLPTEEELTEYRKSFSKLGDDLSTEGKLTASRSLPLNRKLLVFLLSTTTATDAKNITKSQWDDFFARVTTARQLSNGLVGLAKLVNKVNGLDEKGKKITA